MAEHDFHQAGAGDGFDDEIDLFELVQNLWEDKWLISAITGLAAVASVLVALSLPNIYSASTLLKPQSAEGGIGGLARQYGGLASLAGVDVLGSHDLIGFVHLLVDGFECRMISEEFFQSGLLGRKELVGTGA